MPKEVEDRLKRTAAKRHMSEKERNAYVYGTMNKLGLLHHGKKKRHRKGE